MKSIVFAAVAACVVGLASITEGATLYNQSLAGGFNVGSGIPNNNFAVGTSTNSELGLRARPRFLNSIPSDNTGLYTAQPGENNIAPTVPGYAKWNFDFSIKTTGSSITKVDFLIDSDPSTGTAFTNIGGAVGANFSSQDSFNMGMAFLHNAPFNLPAFNFNTAGLYDFKLIAYTGSTVVNEVGIQVQVVPVPLASTAGMAMLSMLTLRRRA